MRTYLCNTPNHPTCVGRSQRGGLFLEVFRYLDVSPHQPPPQASFFRLRLKALQSPVGELPGGGTWVWPGTEPAFWKLVKRTSACTQAHETPWMERRALLLVM